MTGQAAAIAAELVSGGSLEVGAHRPQDAREIAALLPAGTPVYVNHLPRHRLLDTIPTLVAVREAGLEPVPHIAARRIRDRAHVAHAVRAHLQRAARHQVGGAGRQVAGRRGVRARWRHAHRVTFSGGRRHRIHPGTRVHRALAAPRGWRRPT